MTSHDNYRLLRGELVNMLKHDKGADWFLQIAAGAAGYRASDVRRLLGNGVTIRAQASLLALNASTNVHSKPDVSELIARIVNDVEKRDGPSRMLNQVVDYMRCIFKIPKHNKGPAIDLAHAMRQMACEIQTWGDMVKERPELRCVLEDLVGTVPDLSDSKSDMLRYMNALLEYNYQKVYTTLSPFSEERIASKKALNDAMTDISNKLEQIKSVARIIRRAASS